MQKFTSITLTVNKNKKPENNLPDFNMSVKAGENPDGTGKFINVGGGWKKQDKNGQTYMSLSLATAYNKDTNERLTYTNQNGDIIPKVGFVLVDETELRELMKKATANTGEAYNDLIPF